MKKLEKKFGLAMAICMVVGIVIGSGVFFKAQNVLDLTGGNVLHGVIAWLVGGAVMMIMSMTFAIMATKYERTNGVMDYAEVTCGKTYAYFIGWFISFIYFPAMTGVLAWVSARYTMVAVFGYNANSPEALFSPECIAIGAAYLIIFFAINIVSPKLSEKIQVSTTVIKLIPIAFVALVGTIIGLVNGTLVENFNFVGALALNGQSAGNGIFAAVCCTAFAYEGWIIATSINSEIKDSKKNLPLALLIGSGIVVVAYVCYYVGVLGLAGVEDVMANGTNSAFNFFGTVGAGIINFLIILSCLGTLNGLTVGCSRGLYSIAVRGEGPKPKFFSAVDESSNMPYNSAVFSLLVCIGWFVYFIGASFFGWFGVFAFDSSELPIITIYLLYIPMLVMFMIKEKELGWVKRFLLPSLSIIGCVVMITASIFNHKIANLYYLAVFAVIMALGAIPLIISKRASVKQEEISE